VIAEPGSRIRDASVPAPGWLARQVQALFAEARRRRRRRRLVVAAAALAAAALAGAALVAHDAVGRPRPRSVPHGEPQKVSAPRTGLPPALVAWFDGDGALRIGNVATLAQRPVAQLAWQPCCTLVTAGDAIYWAGQARGRSVVQDYVLGTRVIRNVAPGWAVFASVGGRTAYIVQSERRLLALPADGSGPGRRLVTPPGWQMAVPLPTAVAGGIMVSGGGRKPAIGLWHPRTGTIRVIGRGWPMATWTQPSGRGSLIAWGPAGCRGQSCPIDITSTATWRTLTVRDPQHSPFLGQGGDAAFSPDGASLAVFIGSPGRFVPALVNTATGTVRLVGRAIMANGEAAGWLLWLPGGTRLLAGPAYNANHAGYAIDARTATAKPFSFFPGCCYPGTSPYDIGYGAVLVHPPAARYGQNNRQRSRARPLSVGRSQFHRLRLRFSLIMDIFVRMCKKVTGKADGRRLGVGWARLAGQRGRSRVAGDRTSGRRPLSPLGSS
jgi:hypothetical protein